jgi:hypothetical protein
VAYLLEDHVFKKDLGPDDDDWRPSAIDASDRFEEIFGPIDPKQYHTVLTPLDIPPYMPPKDTTAGITGWSTVPGAVARDHISYLTLLQKAQLLGQNNIFLSKQQDPDRDGGIGLGSLHAYSAELKASTKYAVHFKKVRLEHPAKRRQDSLYYSYTKFESDLQKHLISESKISGGIPKLFKAELSYGYGTASAGHSSNAAMHLVANQSVPKAAVIFDKDDLTLNPKFIAAVTNAVHGGTSPHNQGRALLTVLREWGEFVPTEILLGGRISLSETTSLEDGREFESTRHKFGAAGDARFKAGSVPVELGGGTDLAVYGTADASTVKQAKNLKLELEGGDESLASSNPHQFGIMWMNSLASYKEWDIIGHAEESLVPIIDLLPADLRKECQTRLRTYLLSQLDRREIMAGHSGHDEKLEDKNFKHLGNGKPFAGKIWATARCFSQVQVIAAGNVDGLKLTQMVYTGAKFSGPGKSERTAVVATIKNDQSHYWEPIELDPNELITALEVWIDKKTDPKKPTVHALAIKTSRGNRYPRAGGFYGTNLDEKKHTYELIEAPRVRTLSAYKGRYIHGIGLVYLDVADSADSRNFLIAMDPILFPNSDYGPLA